MPVVKVLKLKKDTVPAPEALLINKVSIEQLKSNEVSHYSLIEQLKKNGFSAIEKRVPLDVIMQGDELFNVDGPFDSDWRRGDSIWSLVSDDDLNDVLEFLKGLKNSSKLKEFIQKNDEPRSKYGQITFIIAHKKM